MNIKKEYEKIGFIDGQRQLTSDLIDFLENNCSKFGFILKKRTISEKNILDFLKVNLKKLKKEL